MGQDMFIKTRITEKAAGRIITEIRPEYELYPYETINEKGETVYISSKGFAEVVYWRNRESVRRMITYVLRDRGIRHFGKDAPLTAEMLREIYIGLLLRGCIRENAEQVLDEDEDIVPNEHRLLPDYPFMQLEGMPEAEYEMGCLESAVRIHQILCIDECSKNKYLDICMCHRCGVPKWLADHIPDPADIEQLRKYPERFGIEYMWVNYY